MIIRQQNNHPANIYNQMLQQGIDQLQISVRLFARLFTRAVAVAMAPVPNAYLGLPQEIWQYRILPKLSERDIRKFSTCSRETLAICHQRYRLIDFNLFDLTEESLRVILSEAAGAKKQEIKIICSSNFKDVELIRNVLARQDNLAQHIIELDLSAVHARINDNALTISILLTKVPNLRTLTFGKIGTGAIINANRNGYVRLDLSNVLLPQLEKINFNGVIFGTVTFPRQLRKLKEINHTCMLWELSSRLSAYREHPWSYPYLHAGRATFECHGTLDLRQCSHPNLSRLSKTDTNIIKYFLIPLCLVLIPMLFEIKDLKILVSLLFAYGIALYLLQQRS